MYLRINTGNENDIKTKWISVENLGHRGRHKIRFVKTEGVVMVHTRKEYHITETAYNGHHQSAIKRILILWFFQDISFSRIFCHNSKMVLFYFARHYQFLHFYPWLFQSFEAKIKNWSACNSCPFHVDPICRKGY